MSESQAPAPDKEVPKDSVGLLVMTRGKADEPMAVLQVRGQRKLKFAVDPASSASSVEVEPESFPGAHQVTVHGRRERGEGLYGALLREAGEELAGKISSYVRGYVASRLRGSVVPEAVFGEPIYRGVGKKGEPVVTYGVEMPAADFWDLIRWGRESGGGNQVSREEFESKVMEIDYSKDRKLNGYNPRREIAMFPDEIVAVREAFRRSAEGILVPALTA